MGRKKNIEEPVEEIVDANVIKVSEPEIIKEEKVIEEVKETEPVKPEVKKSVKVKKVCTSDLTGFLI